MDDLHSHSGEVFHRWRAGMAASVGAVIVDDQRATSYGVSR